MVPRNPLPPSLSPPPLLLSPPPLKDGSLDCELLDDESLLDEELLDDVSLVGFFEITSLGSTTSAGLLEEVACGIRGEGFIVRGSLVGHIEPRSARSGVIRSHGTRLLSEYVKVDLYLSWL